MSRVQTVKGLLVKPSRRGSFHGRFRGADGRSDSPEAPRRTFMFHTRRTPAQRGRGFSAGGGPAWTPPSPEWRRRPWSPAPGESSPALRPGWSPAGLHVWGAEPTAVNQRGDRWTSTFWSCWCENEKKKSRTDLRERFFYTAPEALGGLIHHSVLKLVCDVPQTFCHVQERCCYCSVSCRQTRFTSNQSSPHNV